MGALPVLKTAQALQGIESGESIELISDSDEVLEHLQELVSRGALIIENHESVCDGIKIYIRKL
jgi:TusA-related sulfurtransferase